MVNLDKKFAELTAPKDLSASFDKHLREFLAKTSESAVVAYAIGLMEGDDPARYPDALRHLGGEQAEVVLRSKNFDAWPLVWGARALRYVWHPKHAEEATRLVLEHLRDPRWRVAEMCTKVVRAHELREGADSVAVLTTHRLARVRVQALRALGVVGETRHLPLVHAALSDPEKDVRREAKKTLELRASKLGLSLQDLLEGRFPH